MASTITYKGSTIATAQNNTKTLLTQGKYMEGNVIVTDSTPPPSLQNKTVTPTESAQAITADGGFDGLGTVNVNAIPSQYKDMSGELAFIGVDAEWVKQIFNQSYKLEDTLYNGWTASTTAKAIVASQSISPVYAADMEDYEYLIRWRFRFERTGTEGATLKAVPDIECQEYTQMLIKRPSSLANIEDDNFNGNACITFLHAPLMLYYNTSGTRTYTWAATYGFYIGMNAATFSSSTSNTPNITFKTPTINARCNSSYFATARAAEIDQTVTSMWMTGDLYRVRKGAFVRGQYGWLIDTFNNFPEQPINVP